MPRFRSPRASALHKIFTQSSELIAPDESHNGLGELVLNINQGCNLSCTYCFADKGLYGSNKNILMSFEVAKRAIDAFILKYNCIKSIKFFGGEPLLNFHLITEVCHYFDHLLEIGKISNTPQFKLVTNLTVLNEEIIECLSTYEFGVTVSLDGPKEVNDNFRKFENGTGSFGIVDNNIRILRANIIDGYHLGIESVYGPQHTQINMSMTDLLNFFIDRYCVYNIVIHPIMENEYSKVLSCFPEEIMQKYYSNIFDIACNYGKHLVKLVAEGKEIGFVYMLLEKKFSKNIIDSHCGLGVSTITINVDGGVYPCYTLINENKFLMSNTYDTEVFSDGFTNIQLVFLNNKKSTNPICLDCDIFYTCSACIGSMFRKWRDLSKPVPFNCQYYLGLREGLLLGIDEISADDAKWKLFVRTLDRIGDLATQKMKC